MKDTGDRVRVGLPRKRCAIALRCASLVLCLSFILASPVFSDVVKLKNGELIKCKVVKEMQDLIKVRMPHRGKIVTTFLNKGSVESISKTSDVENRQFFQAGGVHNPGRAYEPVYFSGSASAPTAAKGPGGARQTSAKGKGETAAKKRGIDARRERSEARAKERSDRFGQRTSKSTTGSTTGISGTSGSTGSSSSSSSSSATSPSTSSSSSSSMSIGQ